METERRRRLKYRQAALVYLAAGALVILLTVFGPGLRQMRQEESLRLLIGLPFVLLFALLIWLAPVGPPQSASTPLRLWALVHRGLVAVLVVTNGGRAVTFFANAVGQRLRIHSPLTTAELTFRVTVERGDPVLHFWLNSLLMAVIVAMLLRALLDLRFPVLDTAYGGAA